ncbi:fork head domain-domain-containing protein [Clohesyomyces aquaticus]|uniref:Fork head domain-domain-containing protein n=1 Tax=Clohesyomyces aquaticus TaxID=1231657 RepID=A0A1Y1ZQJ6_9PLEO|nr:fork head domain-domain-containing protein [Clohesyomyces aquaticus]
MPPSSNRRLRSRREPDPPQHSEADTPESIATPSRKRRRLNGQTADRTAVPADDAPRARITESVGSNDSNTTLPNGADAEAPLDPIEKQNLIIASLRTPGYLPNAAIDYANDLQARRNKTNNVAAYAKIAARDWCFFVQKTDLRIGRADSAVRPNPPSSQDLSGLPSTEQVNEWGVDIDLGPERQISRIHAEINFDTVEQKWFIVVNSRNGLKLDDSNLSKGARAPLHSGICIGIMGTQMLFLLANQEDEFHPMLWRQVRNDPGVDGSDEEGNAPNRSLPHAHPSGPTPKRENYDPFPSSSHPRHKQSSQSYGNQLTSTPGRPEPGTPLAVRSDNMDPRSKGSPSAFSRGLLLESAEDIDYSVNPDIKPPHSYAQLIGQAILNSPEQMLTLANIYMYIKQKYAFFRESNSGWQNSIRHNLSLSKCFEKVARRTDEPGKGMKWKIADSEREDFIRKQLQPRKGGGLRMNSSGPNSPAVREAPSQATERLVGVMNQPDLFGKPESGPARIKSPPRSATPPLASYPMANESYTPDRGPRSNPFERSKQSLTRGEQKPFVTPAKRLFQETNASAPAFSRDPEAVDSNRQLDDPSSPPNVDPAKSKITGLKREAANSPPPLYSDATNNGSGGQDGGRPNNAGLVTPLVTRHAPRLAPPSTAQVPSQFMNFSSPAPFWKYIDLPSTPARPMLDLSPIKMKKDAEEDKEVDEEPAQPSSPPIMPDDDHDMNEDQDEDNDNEKGEEDDVGPDSPSRTVSRPASRNPGLLRSRSNSNINPHPAASANGGMVRGASLASFEEDPEEEGFDLAKYANQNSHAQHTSPAIPTGLSNRKDVAL